MAGMEFTSTGDEIASIIADTTVPQTLMLDEGEDIAELEREDDVTVDVDGFRSLWLQFVDSKGAEVTEGGIPKQDIIEVVLVLAMILVGTHEPV